MAERQTQYKYTGKDSEALRKNRIEQVVTIRKEKRDDIMSKRRNIPESEYALFNKYTYFLSN
jgi:hypothetical protein